MRSLAFFLLAALLFAADITGKYTTTVEAPDGPHVLVFNLKADGAILTGTVGDGSGARAIRDGKLQGDNFSFNFTTDYQGDSVKLICKGQISGGDLKFSMGTDDGSWSADLTAKRSN